MLQKGGKNRLFAFKTTQPRINPESPPYLLRSGDFCYVCTRFMRPPLLVGWYQESEIIY